MKAWLVTDQREVVMYENGPDDRPEDRSLVSWTVHGACHAWYRGRLLAVLLKQPTADQLRALWGEAIP